MNLKPRLLLVLPTATIVATLAFAGIAHANPSQASATCEGGIVYSGHDYPPAGNTVTIVIDGAIVKTSTFGTATSGTVANPDKTKPHTWAVIWDRYNGTDGDRTQSGAITACVAPTTTTTTVAATTTTLAPTTTMSSLAVVTLETPAPAALVAVDIPPVPQPQGVLSAAGGQMLPQTGGGSNLLLAGGIAVAAGAVAMLVARRRVA